MTSLIEIENEIILLNSKITEMNNIKKKLIDDEKLKQEKIKNTDIKHKSMELVAIFSLLAIV